MNTGFGVYGWDSMWAGNAMKDVAQPDLFVDLATSLERAGFDFMMLEDSSVIPDVHGGNLDDALKRGVVRHDPMPLVPLVAKATSRLGIVATAATTFYPPFLAARLYNTLDHLTHGRVGMNIVTASPHAAAQNYGYEKLFEHDLRYRMADDWMKAVNALWDTWEPDALVGDVENHVFADPSKVHYANYEGEFYKTRGPLNTVPSPQHKPVVCQAGGSPAGRDVAAMHADCVLATVVGVEAMKEYRDDMSERLIKFGRKPTDLKVLFLIAPVLGDTDEEAQGKYERSLLARQANVAGNLSGMSYATGLDFSAFALDEPLPDLTGMSNGHQSILVEIMKASEGGKTLREVAQTYFMTESAPLIGSPDTVAEQMGEMMEYAGGDGFLINGPITRKNVTEICDGLAPALRRRGLIRSEYEFEHFRDNLLAF
jgi:FMN-dependent oxidoreductase (nitrilotriacetate monooxygenase family)